MVVDQDLPRTSKGCRARKELRPTPESIGGINLEKGEPPKARRPIESRSRLGDDGSVTKGTGVPEVPRPLADGARMPLDWLTRLDPLRRIRCPFCFETFAACEMHLRCDDHYCKTDFGKMIDDPILSKALNGPRFGDANGATLRSPWWVDPRADARRGSRRHLDWMVLPDSLNCPNCKKPTDVRLCPRCHSRLPDSVVTLDAGHIAIFGPQSVGKTTYVTVLIHELEHRVGPARGFTLDPLTDEIRERYDREYHEMTYGAAQFGVGEDPDGESYRRSHFATPSIETNRRILQPLVYRVTSRKGPKKARPPGLCSRSSTPPAKTGR